MKPKFSKGFSSPIELEIRKELQNYEEALNADVEPRVLLSIVDKIKLLQKRLRSKKSSGSLRKKGKEMN